jgi:hypothetical protein
MRYALNNNALLHYCYLVFILKGSNHFDKISERLPDEIERSPAGYACIRARRIVKVVSGLIYKKGAYSAFFMPTFW